MTGPAGRLVVVTGAAGGIGAATAAALAAEGARVVATDLVEPPDLPAGVAYRRLDVSSPADWAALVTDLDGAPVHGLVNNAGTTWRARLLDVDVADMARVYGVNVCGPLLGIQALVPLMGPGSSIVNIGSVAALTGHFPVAYTTSKWAVRALGKIAATELGPAGIRVNTVNPGYVDTPMTASASPAFRESNLAETPLGRSASPAEVAAVVVFLLGVGATYVTGSEIAVDGGLTSHGGVKSISDAMR